MAAAAAAAVVVLVLVRSMQCNVDARKQVQRGRRRHMFGRKEHQEEAGARHSQSFAAVDTKFSLLVWFEKLA